MKHVSREKWQAYILDQLSEDVRQQLEEHVYSCDVCLPAYMEALELEAKHLPVYQGELVWPFPLLEMDQSVEEDAHFSQQETNQLPKNQKAASKSVVYRTLFHYGIAASITLFLTATGFFQQLSSWSDTLQVSYSEKTVPVSEEMLDKTLDLLNFFDLHPREGK